jgi:hypothetical protein
VSKLTVIDVAQMWQAVENNRDTAQLLADIDDMDLAGFQLIHRLVCDGYVSLSQLNPNIAQTLSMMGCRDRINPVSIRTTQQKEISQASETTEISEIRELTEVIAAIDAITVIPNTDAAQVHHLSWKEIRKTIMTMNLSVAQIDLSMSEGEYSVDTLIDTFSFMNGEIEQINSLLQQDHIDITSIRDILVQQSGKLSDKADASIVAFQFYDKLSQRLRHVSESLSALTDIISCKDRVVDNDNWDKFMDKMSKYACMREESELFEMIFERGYSAETAVSMIKEILSNRMEAAREKHKQDAPNFEDDIELF